MSSTLALYFHWPFCEHKCQYCAFNSYPIASISEEQSSLLMPKYLQELQAYYRLLGPRKLISIFFGGGTPSLLNLDELTALLQAVDQLWGISTTTEISLEANPHSGQEAKIRAWKQLGVNRLSWGIQALDDQALRILGRIHNTAVALKAIELTARYFSNYSIDLLYGRYQQTVAAWRQELQQAMQLSPHHLSLYQLTVERGTPLAKAVKRQPLPSEESILQMFRQNQQLLATQGIVQYEISNFARPGYECIHNLNYWRGGEYLGIGPGAHSRIVVNGQRIALSSTKHITSWLKRPIADRQLLTRRQQMEEFILMGLRLTQEGLNQQVFQMRFGQNLMELVPIITDLLAHKFLQQRQGQVAVTSKGMQVLDSLIVEMVSSLIEY